jgi:hypothetical protein
MLMLLTGEACELTQVGANGVIIQALPLCAE